MLKLLSPLLLELAETGEIGRGKSASRTLWSLWFGMCLF